MKNKMLVGLFCFLTFQSSGQIITFDILENLRKMNIGNVEEYLVKRNWELGDIIEKTDSSSSVTTFAYQSNNSSNYSINLLTFIEGQSGNNQNRIFFETTHKDLYIPILNRLTLLNINLVKTKIIDKKIKKLYKSNDIAVLITTTPLMDDLNNPIPYYIILISDRHDFEMKLENRQF